MKLLILIRGIPGSGKSTLAEILTECCEVFGADQAAWFEADMWFAKDGTYRYDKKYLPYAHNWCQSQTREAMRKGVETVIVSNVFSKQWQLEPYRNLAHIFNYKVQEIICKGDFGSVHNVPAETVRRMAQEFEF